MIQNIPLEPRLENLIDAPSRTSPVADRRPRRRRPLQPSPALTDVRIQPNPDQSADDATMQMRISWTLDSGAITSPYYLRIFWRVLDADHPRWSHATVDDVRRTHFDVQVHNYTEHLVRLRLLVKNATVAQNRDANQKVEAYGWPSQGRPERAPAALRRCANGTDKHLVCLHWDAVEAASLNGRLRGYRLDTWREDGIVVGTSIGQRVQRVERGCADKCADTSRRLVRWPRIGCILCAGVGCKLSV